MLDIFTSSVNQGRSFALVNKVLEQKEKSHLFITLELNESEVIKRLRILNNIKFKHNIEDVNCVVKMFPSNAIIDDLIEFITEQEHKYDTILIDQSYLVQTKNKDENESYSDNIRKITGIYSDLSNKIQKPVSITFNLGRSFMNTDSYDKLAEARMNLIKGTKSIDEFIKGNFNIINIFKRENIVYELNYPYKKSEVVVDLTTYTEGYKSYEDSEVFG